MYHTSFLDLGQAAALKIHKYFRQLTAIEKNLKEFLGKDWNNNYNICYYYQNFWEADQWRHNVTESLDSLFSRY